MFFKIIIFIGFIFIAFVKCFTHDHFCSFIDDNKDFVCKRHQCGQNLCSFEKRSCTNLKLWSNLMYKNTPFINEKRIEDYFNLFSKIKGCQKNDYIRLSPIVCSNKLKCDSKKQSFFRNIIGLKPKECFCFGKFKYDCGNEMCAINKVTCKFLFNKDKNSTSLSNKIKKCL